MGALNSSDTELNGEDHAFIVLKIDDERVIYDPMNPELITDNEGRIRAFMPTTFAGGQNILDGGKTKVTRKEYSLPPAGTRSTLSDNIKSEKSSIYTADINGQLGVLFDELLDLD